MGERAAKNIVVIGGSAAGMAVALALSEKGHRVVVLEKDGGALPDDHVEAFEKWNRDSAPQVRTSHGFLARLRNILRERAPAFLDALFEQGAYEIPYERLRPATLPPAPSRPDDEGITMLACRRVTFDWTLRKFLERFDGVAYHAGVAVTGLSAEKDAAAGLFRITGVRTQSDGGERHWPADLVVDASGRRSPLPGWLSALGVGELQEESEDCGFFICSRFYKLLPGVTEPPECRGFNAVNLEYLQVLLVRGDSGIFSVMTATKRGDADFHDLIKPAGFDAAISAIPMFTPWIDPERAVPITDVRGFGRIMNTRRFFLREGEPVALGLVAVGDSSMHTNPAYGRGVTQAFLQAYLLADALERHPEDFRQLALAYEAEVERELGSWYRLAVRTDRGARSFADDSSKSEAGWNENDPKAFMRSLMREGFGHAVRTDPVVFRAMMRSYNMIDGPQALLRDQEVVKRILEAWRTRGAREKALDGPPRDEMIKRLHNAVA